MYWCLAPMHVNFSDKKNEARKKWNFCLKSLLKGRSDMRVIKLKEVWNFNDKSLIAMNRVTDTGFYTYWRAADTALKFNISRHELFLAETKLQKDEEKRQMWDIVPVAEAAKPSSSLAQNGADRRVIMGQSGNESIPEENRDCCRRGNPEDVPNFFQHHRHNAGSSDQFHWCRGQQNHNRNYPTHSSCGNRFFLPCPRCR